MKFTPMARVRTSTSLGLGVGTGRSTRTSASAPPGAETWTARIVGMGAGYTRPYRGRTMSQGQFDPEYVFTHHHATPKKLADYEAIHAGAKKFAQVLLDHVPEC